MFSILVMLTLLRGDGTSSVIKKCSPLDWISRLVFLAICLIAVSLAALVLKKEHSIREKAGLSNDIEWSSSKIAKYAAISVSIGLVSGSLGIGGGVIITPLLFSNG